MSKVTKRRGHVTVQVTLRLDPRRSDPEGLLVLQFGLASQAIFKGAVPSEWDRPLIAQALMQISSALAPLVKEKKKTLRMAQRADLILRGPGGTVKNAVAQAIKDANARGSAHTFASVQRALQRLRAARRSYKRETK